MELKQLQYFRAIARDSSISVAAEKMYITQPALSRSLKRLEDEVMAPLFVRKNNGVELTEAGEAFLIEVDQAFMHFEQGLNNARMIAAQQRPTMAISCAYEDFEDAGFIEQLHCMFPDVQTSMDTLPPTQALRELFAGNVDFALVPHEVAHAGIVYEHLLSEEMLLSSPNGHPLCGKRFVSLADLNGCSCVCNEVAFDWKSISQICESNSVSLKLAFSSNSHQTTGRFKGLTGSVLFIPIGAVAGMPKGDERKLVFPSRIVPQVFRRNIYLAYHEGRSFSTADKYFVELLRNYARQRLQMIQKFAAATYGSEMDVLHSADIYE